MNLNQVTVPSQDVARSVAFYRGLGLQLIVEALPRYARFECPDGTATFSVHLVADLPSSNGVVVYFECKALDQKVVELKTAGFTFHSEPEDKSWLWREADLYDPDGNRIILFFAGAARKYPPWRIRG